MSIRIVCSWRVLFQKAHAEGQARLRYKANPTPETEQELADLVADHDAYKDLCLEADEMIDTPLLEMPSA